MIRPLCAVQIVEAPRPTKEESIGIAQGESTIIAAREARADNGPSLRRSVELELVVVRNVSSTTLRVGQNSILKCQLQSTRRSTGNHLHVVSRDQSPLIAV